jgi:quercetin dioxygenase-like cupin family protein
MIATADHPLTALLHGAVRRGRATSVAVVDRTIREGEMPPLHLHDEDEVLRVVEGSMTAYVGDEVVALAAGDELLAPAGVPHTYVATSPRARYLAAAAVPSVARYEDFLRAVARPAPCGAGAEEPAAVEAIAAAAGVTVLGAPGALPGA